MLELMRAKPAVQQLTNFDVARLAAQGSRVIAVAVRGQDRLQIAGLLALDDPPRVDSKTLIDKLKSLGIRVLMMTGDGLKRRRASPRWSASTEAHVRERRCAVTSRKRSMSSRRSIRKTNSIWCARYSAPAMR